jgi:leucyl aminopeptidase
MFSKIASRPFSAWLHQRLASVQKDVTKAILIDKTEVSELQCLKPYSESEDFQKDLSLLKHQWIFTPQGRLLVVQQSTEEKDAKKQMRDLGVLTCHQLQKVKASSAEVICSSKVDPNLVAQFQNAFSLTNYEWSQKGNVVEKDEEPKDDPRLERKSKLVDQITISHENLVKDTKQEIKTNAQIFARNLANTRGSEATPCWMEE